MVRAPDYMILLLDAFGLQWTTAGGNGGVYGDGMLRVVMLLEEIRAADCRDCCFVSHHFVSLVVVVFYTT
jgi:hypothetical protein